MVLDTKVRQVLTRKGSDSVFSITPGESVFAALKEMARHDVGALVVIDQGAIVGVISERDYARKVALDNRTSLNTKVREIMSSPVITVGPDDLIEGCLTLMIDNRIRHLPVVESGGLIGLISVGDVVRAVIEEQEFMIDELTHYVRGSYSGYFDRPAPTAYPGGR